MRVCVGYLHDRDGELVKKRVNARRFDYGLTARETVTAIYISIFRDYGWTRDAIDDLELSYVCDLIVVKDKLENPVERAYGEEFF